MLHSRRLPSMRGSPASAGSPLGGIGGIFSVKYGVCECFSWHIQVDKVLSRHEQQGKEWLRQRSNGMHVEGPRFVVLNVIQEQCGMIL